MGTLSLGEALCPTVQAFIQQMWSPCFCHVDEKQGSPGVTQWELWHLGNVIDEFCPPTEEFHGERGLQKPNSQGTFQAKHLECNSESAELCQTQLDTQPCVPMRAAPQPDFPPLKWLFFILAFSVENSFDNILGGKDPIHRVSFSALLSPGRRPSLKGMHCRGPGSSEFRHHQRWVNQTSPGHHEGPGYPMLRQGFGGEGPQRTRYSKGGKHMSRELP